MNKFNELLAINDSHLSKLLYSHLYGLHAALNKAKCDHPDDPGINICNDLLGTLESLLEKIEPSNHNSINHHSLPINPNFTASANNQLKLSELCQLFSSDERLKEILGTDIKLKSNTDADLWAEINRKLLRVPENLAKEWRKLSLEMAKKVGIQESKQSVINLPYNTNEIIYSGLTDSIKAQGLSLSINVNCDSQIDNKNLDGDDLFLAKIVSCYIKLIELETFNLYHCFEKVNRIGLQPLSVEENKAKYIKALIDSFHAYAKATDIKQRLLKIVELDEAIHSLVYKPTATSDSWWGKFQKHSRDILRKIAQEAQSSYKVDFFDLNGLYADNCDFSKNDYAVNQGGRPKYILTCLRVYLKIDNDVYPGRVIYRGFQ